MTFNFEKVRENLERVASEPEGFQKHSKRKEFEQIANDALERCSFKAGWRWSYQDEIIRCRSLDRLTNILTLADGDIEGWRIIDLGCGAPDDEWRYHHKGWLPYKAEALNDLGATVGGVELRENPYASYEHRVVDFGDFCETHHYGDCFDPKPSRKFVDKETMESAKKS